MVERKGIKAHLQKTERNKSAGDLSCKKSSSIGKSTSMPCLYYIAFDFKFYALFSPTKNTSLNKAGNQFSRSVFIMVLALLALSREGIFKSSWQKLSLNLGTSYCSAPIR